MSEDEHDSEYRMSEDEHGSENFVFSADISQLLHLIINTFYKDTEIFLRELISNAADAIDKIRFAALTDHDVLKGNKNLEIRVKVDPDKKTLTVWDDGVGMDKEELRLNLGSIARSGTKNFMDKFKEGGDLALIGQFGVGFYSAFLVADKVTVVSRKTGGEQYRWESSAKGSFAITRDETDPLIRGTRITLNIKDDQLEYLEEDRLRELIVKHSGFVPHPVKLWVERTVEKVAEPDSVEEVEEEEGAEEDAVGATAPVVEDVDEEVETSEKKAVEPVLEKVWDWDQVNKTKAVWLRQPAEVTPEEYDTLYKGLTGDTESHLALKHFRAEGTTEFTSVLFIPKSVPKDIFDSRETRRKNIKLYVRRVFVMDKSEDVLPDYLSFMRGVVDSDDFPLNVSRQILQQSKTLQTIKRTLTRKCLQLFEELAEDPTKYKEFYSRYAKALKLGVYDDPKNRTRILELLRFRTNKADVSKGGSSLKDYIARMKEGQKGIYYLAAESENALTDSPFLEKLTEKGLECLFMTDPVDEYMMQQLKNYEGKEFIPLVREGIKWGDDTDKAVDDPTMVALCGRIRQVIGQRIVGVKISRRLCSSPCCLVTGNFGLTANMLRIVKAQALNHATGPQMPAFPTMEINPDHELIKVLLAKFNGGEQKLAEDLTWMLYDSALLASGFHLEQPVVFVNRIHALLAGGLGLAPMVETDTVPSQTTEASLNETSDDQDEVGEASTDTKEVTGLTSSPAVPASQDTGASVVPPQANNEAQSAASPEVEHQAQGEHQKTA